MPRPDKLQTFPLENPSFHTTPSFGLRLLCLLAVCALLMQAVACKRKAAPPGAEGGWALAPAFRESLVKAGATRVETLRVPAAAGGKTGAIPRIRAEVLAADWERATRAVLAEARHKGLRVEEISARPGEPRTREWMMHRGAQPMVQLELREIPPPATLAPARFVVAIVIDDLGQNLRAAEELIALRQALTFSVMPNLPYSRQTAQQAHGAGLEVMLHLPMQPEAGSRASVSPQQITLGMKPQQVERLVESGLASVPYVEGVNNHMGSAATANTALMEDVMRVLASRHLFFIDSRTTPATVALDVARQMGVPAFYRSVFLDDAQSVPATLAQLRLLLADARRQGAALAIGHPYPTTIAALREFLPGMIRNGVALVPVSRLIERPQVARLWPPKLPKANGR